MSVHLDRAYDSNVVRRLLEERGLEGAISKKGAPDPLGTTKRWVVERINSWTNVHKKLLWRTERCGQLIDFWIALSNAIIIVGRLIREAWTHYRWEGRSVRHIAGRPSEMFVLGTIVGSLHYRERGWVPTRVPDTSLRAAFRSYSLHIFE